MEDKYYFVQVRIHPDTRKVSQFHGISFVEVSEGVLEHIAGDRFITQSLEVVDEELRTKKEVSMHYDIFPVKKIQFDSYVGGYSERLRQEEMQKRVHSMRRT